MFSFKLKHVDDASRARHATLDTPHGTVDLPAFMPVGTQGSVKGMTVEMLRASGAQMVLGNTYHLALRPGAEIVERLGGLHEFMGWSGPILTDSGGFQVFSLAQTTQVTEEGAVFRSHIDGSRMELTPERAIEIQERLGSDIAMVLDHVVALPASDDAVRDALDRTVRWARRCRDAARRDQQTLFGIVQGGLDPDLRAHCASELIKLDFAGYAIGGLSVGEEPAEMYRVVGGLTGLLPSDRPRYLMGVGRPEDLLEAIRLGVDLFDCVMPTRNGRNALAFTDQGPVRLRNRIHAEDPRPLEADCPCPACAHSRGYLRHLFAAREMLGPVLITAHNLTYYQRLMADVRNSIPTGGFMDLYDRKMAGWRGDLAEGEG